MMQCNAPIDGCNNFGKITWHCLSGFASMTVLYSVLL